MVIPRWKEIANAIEAEIGEGKLASGDLLPSEAELAARWNVSRVTAHRAMHELHQQGVVVRKRRAGTVVAARRPKTGRIAVFLNTRDFLEQQYLAGIRDGLPDEYDLLCCDIRSDPKREAQYLERMHKTADGILCIPTCDPKNTPIIKDLLRRGLSIVCVDCVPAEAEIDAVVSDNYGVSLQALRFLIGRGHRRIAHFTVDRMYDSAVRERYEAYRDALSEVGVDGVRPWLREFPYNMTHDPLRPPQAVQDALAAQMYLSDRPTALFCAHDYILSAVIQACQALHISIPHDLEILSFNDCPPIVPFLPDSVHRIVQRAYMIGQGAAEQLCRRLREERSLPELIRIPPAFYPGAATVIGATEGDAM